MCKALDKLKELTPQLPLIPSIKDLRFADGAIVKYKLVGGEALSNSLYSDEDIAIAKFFIPKGIIFPTHVHKESDEWLIILEGTLGLDLEGKTIMLDKYDSIKITADKPHKAIAVEDSTIIAITVPRDDGFPE